MSVRTFVVVVVFAFAVFAAVQAEASLQTVAAAQGCSCNDSCHDTSAIQSALNAVPADGGEVRLPAGNYKITSTLKVKSKTRFRGEGMRASRIFACGDFDLIENANQDATGNAGIYIEDLELDGNRPSNYEVTCNPDPNNPLECTNPWAGIGIELQNVTDFHIQRCFIHDVMRDAINVTGVRNSSTGYSSKGFITNNLLTKNGRPYHYYDPQELQWELYFDGSAVGIIVGTDIVVANNVATNNANCGVIMEKDYAVEVLKHISVTGNILRANKCGVFSSYKYETDGAEHVSIIGNTIENSGEGIRIETTRWYLVADNRISYTWGHGIQILQSVSIDGTISGNHIYDVGVLTTGSDGIRIVNSPSRISITGNHIQGVMSRMRRAIDAPSATDLLIVGNIGRGGTDGTQINAPSSTNLVANNKVN